MVFVMGSGLVFLGAAGQFLPILEPLTHKKDGDAMRIENGGTKRRDEMKVANEILRQLGGNRFIAMTGARMFVGSEDSLSFSIPGNITKNHFNKVRIVLKPTDTYTVSFFKIRGVHIDMISERTMVYADNLRDVFTNFTGLDTHL